MDFWCALWFWPLDRADDLPTREEWWFVLETVLLGNASLAPPAPAERSLPGDPAPDQRWTSPPSATATGM